MKGQRTPRRERRERNCAINISQPVVLKILSEALVLFDETRRHGSPIALAATFCRNETKPPESHLSPLQTHVCRLVTCLRVKMEDERSAALGRNPGGQ